MNLLRDPVILLLATLLMGWGVHAGLQPPKPLRESVPETVFSAGRAKDLLQSLYPDKEPHVAGSPQNEALRDRIVSEFEALGYAVKIQERFHCQVQFGRCSPVENIVAVRTGAKSGSAILLTAHYDSSWAGPGIADDGAGVAAMLEIARLATTQPQFTYDLIFLITDGEEQGLIGADAFALHHELFATVRAVINLEARGVSGASTMFETGEGNRGMIRMLAKNLDRPVANSLAQEVYRRMPNDTDFSIYRDRGLAGVNFAFTEGAAAYHSRIDDLDHLNFGSLQHHGDNAWAMLLALDERNLERTKSPEDAAYIDLFGRQLLHYPLSSAMGVALVLSVLVMVAIRRAFYRQVVFRQVLWTLAGVLLLCLAVPLLGWLLSWPLGRWVDVNPLQHPFPWLGRSVLFLAVVLAISRVLRFLAARASTGSVTAGTWSVFVLMALGLAGFLPTAGYLAVLPLLGFTLGLVLDAFRWKEQPRLLFASVGGLLAAVYLAFYFFFQLDVVLNFSFSQYKVLPLLIPAIASLPLLVWYYDGRTVSERGGLGLALLILAGCVGQHFVPGYTPDVPRAMNLVYREEVGQNSGRASAWLTLDSDAGEPDLHFAGQQGLAPVSLPGFDGVQQQVLAKETPVLDFPDVVASRVSLVAATEAGEHARQLIELAIPPDVRLLAFSFPAASGLASATVDGQLAYDSSLANRHSPNGRSLAINHPRPGKAKLEFEFTGETPAEVLMTARFDLPEELLQSYSADWPLDAQPAFLGSRALKTWRLKLAVESPAGG